MPAFSIWKQNPSSTPVHTFWVSGSMSHFDKVAFFMPTVHQTPALSSIALNLPATWARHFSHLEKSQTTTFQRIFNITAISLFPEAPVPPSEKSSRHLPTRLTVHTPTAPRPPQRLHAAAPPNTPAALFQTARLPTRTISNCKK